MEFLLLIFNKYLDFVHHMYDSVFVGKNEPKWIENYKTTYTSMKSLRKMIEKVGFKSIKVKPTNKVDRAYQEVFRITKSK